jgi:Tfp pilus assembly protein PilF
VSKNGLAQRGVKGALEIRRGRPAMRAGWVSRIGAKHERCTDAEAFVFCSESGWPRRVAAPRRIARAPLCVSVSLWLILSVFSVPSVSAQPRLTFSKDIAPIIWTRCATCHRPGEIGPFSLLTYDDVKRRATQIATVTRRGLMPPWKPTNAVGTFQDDRRLTATELDALQQWIAGGAEQGNPADLPAMPAWSREWRLGTPDLIVRMDEPYTVRADGADVFRTFVIAVPVTTPRYVRAIEFQPGNARVVHHANLGIDRTQSSRQLDRRDAEPGYEGSMAIEARYPEGQLLGWTPGQAPHPSPDGMAWRIDPGSDLVVQLHLQPTGKPETLRASVGLFFTDTPPSRTPIGLRLGSETIDIPAGERAHVITDRYTVPVDVDLLAVQPHAHNLARHMEANVTLPDGSARSLIAIDDWDFRWQDVYRYATPIALPKGTTIAMRYTYDNSADNVRNPHHPPARVVWGQNTTDEMGDLWLQVAARNAADSQQLATDVARKARVEDLAAYRKLLRDHQSDPRRHDAVAALYFEGGQIDQAIAEYSDSIRLDPRSARSQYNLGIALGVRGRRDEAVSAFEAALAIDPDYAPAHNNLGAMLQLLGRVEPALQHYRRAVALRPDHVEAQVNLGLLLSSLGRLDEAAATLQLVLDRTADQPQALAGLSWIRAAAPNDLFSPKDAVALGERAVQLTARRDIAALDALAAAYAAAGRFDEAVSTARAGVDLAVTAGAQDVAVKFRERLELYRQGRSYRLPQR